MRLWIAGPIAAVHVLLGTGAPRASAQASTDPVAALRQQVAGLGLIVWSVRRPLQWSDFRGPPRPGDASAETASSFLYYISCSDSTVHVAVVATFWPMRSWVRPEVQRREGESTNTLLHERGHFDISEIFARRFRRAVAGTAGLCPNRSYEAGRLFDAQNAANEEMQGRYDRETSHGSAREAQSRWAAAIRASLDSLAEYAGHR